MFPDADELAVESDRMYVVYDGRTGAIAHVHRVITHRGATPVSDEEAEARALELASRFGHRGKGLRVLRGERYDGTPQRVDVKTLQLVPEKPAASRRPAKRAAGGRKPSARRRRGR
jgi:hypothetical protein